MIQFFWQFPHFWAIGWVLYDDYKKAGFNLLPTGKRDKATALQIIMYTFWMMIVAVIPVTGLTGALKLSVVSAIIISIFGLVMMLYAFRLYHRRDNIAARQLMLASVLYITVIQIIYVIDKFV